jgi:hypothetical protein
MARNKECHQEIISSGGLHSLLNVFNACSSHTLNVNVDFNNEEDTNNIIRNNELKRAAALAVAYLMPSCSNDRLQVHNVHFDLKLMDCFKYLMMDSHSKDLGKGDREIATIALAHRWINSWINEFSGNVGGGGGSGSRNGSERRRSARKMRSTRHNLLSTADNISNGGSDGTQLMLSKARRRKDVPLMETSEAQEVMEKAVALVVLVARSLVWCDDDSSHSHSSNAMTAAAGGGSSHTRRHSPSSQKNKRSNELTASITLVVESMCAVEAIRPIVAREGLLEVLVEWLQHGGLGLERCASHSLMCLLSTPQDQYLSGWIHSQVMVNEAAIPSIIRLANSERPEVRLAAANIVAALSVAPHTSEAVVEAGGPRALVSLLQASIRSSPSSSHLQHQTSSSSNYSNSNYSSNSSLADNREHQREQQQQENNDWFHFDTSLAFAAASALFKLVAHSVSATTARGWLHHADEGGFNHTGTGNSGSGASTRNTQYNLTQ